MNIEFLIGTYNRPYELTTLLGSLLAQTNPNWKAHVIVDSHEDFNSDGMQKVKNFFSFENRIRFSSIDGPNRDWGNTPRMYGLDQCQEEWMVMTGDDNYYTPLFVNEVFNVIDDNVNFVYCDHVQIEANYNYYRGVLDTNPAISQIDLGAYVTRPKLARQIQFNVKNFFGDGEFANNYANAFCTKHEFIRKIHKVLYVHN